MDRSASSPFSLEALGPRASLMRHVRLEPPFDPLDAIRFRSGNTIIQLADIEGPSADAVCLNAEQLRWACGRQARAALYYVIREAVLTCRGSVTADSSTDGSVVLLARCDISRTDLATELVRTGFARSGMLGSANLKAAMAEAQASKRGLWNGEWTILP